MLSQSRACRAGGRHRGARVDYRVLGDKPPFDYVADEFLAFVGQSPLVAHNAGFDVAFLNAELKRAGRAPIATERVVDTLVLARRKHPGGHNTLDDLCSRYGVDRSRRTQHGALLEPLMRADREVQNWRRDRQELIDLEATEETGSAAMSDRLRRGRP